MITMRLVVAGTPGAGKSTFVRTISEIEVVDTERTTTDKLSQLKKKTTVAFDFGRLTLVSAIKLDIYGTPGQSRFSFMWDFLIQKAHTYILLVAAHRPSDFDYARKIISFMNERVQIPMLIGLTHMDCPGAWDSEAIMRRLGYMNDKHRPPVVIVNPSDRSSVVEALMASMALLIAQYSSDRSVRRGETNQPIQHNVRSTFHLSSRLTDYAVAQGDQATLRARK